MTETRRPRSAVEHRREHHGDVFIDPYEWLRDKSDPEVIEYLEAENAYTEQVTRHLAPLRQKIFDEIKARTKETDLSVPIRRNDWWYYARSFEGKQYSVHCRCPITDPDDWTPPQFDEHTEIPGEQVLLDENVEAAGHDFFAMGAASVSLDANTLAYSVDVRRRRAIHVAVQGLAHRPAVRRRDRRHRRRRDLGRRQPHGLLHTVDDAWRPDTVWRHRSAPGCPPRRSTTSPTSSSGSRSAAPAATSTSSSRRAAP